MSYVYMCRHCGHVIGELEQSILTASKLGFDRLSTEDKQEMIRYQSNGEIHIKSICESCQETLGNNPHYHELDFFIQ
ncbi:MAG TPA: anti-sigma-F factor Fin family protein [Candidatus Dormibacteraeota bacterium]|nr:anti-sigma-F factor Fin family protein [Candidatus Dormibacteraeota bacterium]